MKTINTIALFALSATMVFSFSFAPALAQNRPLEPRGEDETRDYENDEEDDWSRWWGYRSGSDEIDDLDNDRVEDLPIPVLFGVTLADIYPNFGDPRGGGTREHEGLDILAPEWTPIVSPTEAVVTRIGEGSSSGIYVRTANPGGEQFVYMHMVAVADDLDRGDELSVGDVIGFVGETGNARGTTPHLHFEVRDGREALDPYGRVSQEFSLEEKMEFLEQILDDADDPDELASVLVDEYAPVFMQASVEGIDLPEDIADELPEATNLSTSGRDLTIGSEGSDVSALQSRLIAAGFLDISTPTGYFGPLTEAALAEYQRANGISPASGYYGPITREHMSGSSANLDLDYDIENMSRSEMIDLIEELEEMLVDLQAQLN